MRAAVRSSIALCFASLIFACGGHEPPPANPAPPIPSAPPPGAPAHEEHGAINPALHDFHEVLAPMWHAPAGSERIAKACGGQADLSAKAKAVGDAELQADTDAVKAACDKPDHADVEAKLSAVHDRFHKLAEAH